MREFLHAKLHNVEITRALKEYEGSISIDKSWLEMAGIMPYEKVLVADVENGARFSTYVIAAARGSKSIEVNGSAANLVTVGDRVIIMAFKSLNESDIPHHKVTKLLFNSKGLDLVNISFPFLPDGELAANVYSEEIMGDINAVDRALDSLEKVKKQLCN